MSKIIDADALTSNIYCSDELHAGTEVMLKYDVLTAPTVDAVAVARGKWVHRNGIKCSVCTLWSHMAYNYCPNCGAKMEDRV